MNSWLANVRKRFSSVSLTLFLFALYVIGLAVATFVERYSDTATARNTIYNHLWFYLLQALMVANFFCVAVSHRWWKRRLFGNLILHFSFIVILFGALITHLYGFEGIVHIREGETTSVLRMPNGNRELPFSVKLVDFMLIRYPGSQSPSSYESHLQLLMPDGTVREEKIYMNKVVYQQGYRLYQASYDPDEQGTVLSVNNDSLGTGVTYFGYFLLLAGIMGIFVQRESRFRSLLKQLSSFSSSSRVVAPMLFILFSSLWSTAQAQDARHASQTIPREQAELWSRLYVQSPAGRIEPVNTYAAKLLRKIHRRSQFEGLMPEQVLLGFVSNAAYWNGVKIISQKNEELNKKIGKEGNYLAFYDLFESDGSYKLSQWVQSAYKVVPSERSAFEKELMKLDEKVNILYALQHGEMLPLFPDADDPDHRWYSMSDSLDCFSGKDSLFVANIMPWYLETTSEAMRTGDWKEAKEVLGMMDTYQKKRSSVALPSERQLELELFYNKADLFFISMIGYVASGLVMLFLAIACLLRSSRGWVIAFRVLLVFFFAVFLLHTSGITIRWYISEQAPWSNAYESMVYVSWATALAGICFLRRSRITVALAAFFAGIILFVATLNWMDPEITPLVPVLKSYWLMIHVAVITASYGFFGVSFLLGCTSLSFMCFGKHRGENLLLTIRELRIISELSLYIGLFLLTAGIFLGAIWANESWGRYWGWDPKETWALITMMVYAFILHARFVPSLRTDFAFSVMAVFGFASVLMTYFGVNYYLSGLHSYGSGDVPSAIYLLYVLYSLLLLLAVAAWLRSKGERENQKIV